LSITRRLVALHGGVMSLESQMDQGSTFHVYLPLPNLSGRFSAPPAGMSRPALLLLSTGQETSQTFLNLAAQMHLSIQRISSAGQLDAILKETSPSVLAWDLLNARYGEWELVEHIRAHPQLSQLPFIIYRAESDDEVEATEVLMKPVAGKTLLDAIHALRPAGGTGPILIVDDEAEARDFLQRLVNEALPGYPVLSAENGAAALASMQETAPSLVILDLVMPEIDGFMVLEKMRSMPETRQVPVLVMSGKLLSSEDIQRLDYARVTFQSKELLSNDEAAALLRRIIEPGEVLPQPTSVLVKAAIAYLHQNYALPVTRREIAQAVGVSSNYLSRIFRQEVGLSAWDCLNRFRILKAKELLRNSSDPITAIAAQVGFDDSAYFSRIFRKLTGQSPQSYRKA
jgi:AraC-like DNA-binding protein